MVRPIQGLIPARLQLIAKENGYWLELKTTIRRRGWPEKSAKPYGLYYADGGLIASFATLAQLENNLRGRCGC